MYIQAAGVDIRAMAQKIGINIVNDWDNYHVIVTMKKKFIAYVETNTKHLNLPPKPGGSACVEGELKIPTGSHEAIDKVLEQHGLASAAGQLKKRNAKKKPAMGLWLNGTIVEKGDLLRAQPACMQGTCTHVQPGVGEGGGEALACPSCDAEDAAEGEGEAGEAEEGRSEAEPMEAEAAAEGEAEGEAAASDAAAQGAAVREEQAAAKEKRKEVLRRWEEKAAEVRENNKLRKEAAESLLSYIDTLRCHFHATCVYSAGLTGITDEERAAKQWDKWLVSLTQHCVYNKHDHCECGAACQSEDYKSEYARQHLKLSPSFPAC